MTAWLTEGRWHNRRPSNWWRSITERNVQVEWFNMSWQTKREEERRQADQKQDRYSTGMLSTLYPFSFYKRLHVEASCLYSIISTLRRRGSLWAQVSWALHLTTLAVQYTRFIHTAPPQSVCCSYSPQHRNVLLQEWSKQRQESVCLCKFLCVRVEKTKHTLYQRESVYTPLIHHYMIRPLVSLSLQIFTSVVYTQVLQPGMLDMPLTRWHLYDRETNICSYSGQTVKSAVVLNVCLSAWQVVVIHRDLTWSTLNFKTMG